MRRGLRLTPCTWSSEPGTSVAATTNGAADEKSPGTSTSPSESRSAGRTVTLVGRTRDARAGRREHPLGVVARRRRLDHGRLAVGVEAGEQDRRLHLRARDRAARSRSPRSGPRPRSPAAGGRRSSRRRRPSGRAARRSRPIGRARERLVARELELLSALAGEDPGEQPHERARVARSRSARPGAASPREPAAEDAQRLVAVLVDRRRRARARPRSSPRCPPSARSP